MNDTTSRPRIRLPERLAFTAFHVAVAGSVAAAAAVACSAGRSTPAADASADAPSDGGAGDGSGGDACSSAPVFCGRAAPDASCPGYVCDLAQCPLEAGCEPYV